MITVGAFLARNRKLAGLSQRELAERAFKHQSSISRIEMGHISPSLDTVDHLLRAMGRKLILTAGKAEDA